jgi:C4-dicarboxylate-specific signal transduction histidine kinase
MDIIQHLKLILASELSHKKIQLQIDVPPNVYVTIPESEIALVLLNLINNASRALAELSEANRVITISAQDNQQSTLIHVIDNGLGVPAHLVQNLFEIAKDSHSEGLGLGLWLIRHILERHDCQIEYQPNQQGGSIFTLNLPKAKQAKANEVTPYASRV